jgi:O-antigen ligase
LSGRASRLKEAAASAGWLLILLPLLVVLLSVALTSESNWLVRAALAAFCLLAFTRPSAALLVTAALMGYGLILSLALGVRPLRVTEVLVVASLAGCCIHAIRPGGPWRRALADQVSAPVVLLAAAAIASALVWLRVHQIETGYPSDYLRALFRFLVYEYFVSQGDFGLLVTILVFLEGLGLYVAVAALCRMDPAFFLRCLRMLVVGGAGLGVLSVVRLAEVWIRNPEALHALRTTAAGLRISPQIADYIAAGSYFALCWLVALGLAMAARRRRAVWLAAGVPLLAALYLTGSRSVLAAALVGLLVLAGFVARLQSAAVRRVGIVAALAIAAMVASYPWMTGRDIMGETAAASLRTRAELMRTNVAVIETRPLFGIGFDRFQDLADRFASPELNALWQGRKNPHNDFLRIGAELGFLGLGLFLWILVAAGLRIRRSLRESRDIRLAGLAGGLMAFLFTSLISDPLMVREVSHVFWIALGLAVGHSTQWPVTVSGGPDPGGRAARAAALLLGAVIAVSIPIRARQELREVDLRHVSYGLFDWGLDEDGTWNRWSGPRARFFVDGRARVIELALAGASPDGAPQQVEILIDGRLANRLSVGVDWQRLRIGLPEGDGPRVRQVDLRVSPTWVPADVVHNDDRRELGVKLRAVEVLLPQEK